MEKLNLLFINLKIACATSVVILITGCSAPPTPLQIEEAVHAGHTAAREASAAKDPKTAEKGAAQAEKALREAEARVERVRKEHTAAGQAEPPDVQEAVALVERIRPLVHQARSWADLAEEEKRCADILHSLRASAYRTARKGALLAVFQGLALAADQAAEKKPEELHEQVRNAARLAGDLAGHLGARTQRPDGTHDWPGVAEDMRTFSKEPPPNLNLALACGFVFLKQPRWALYEIEAVAPDRLASSEQRAVYRMLRGIAYRFNACPRMAAREFERFKDDEGAKLSTETGPEIESGTYLALGLFYLSEKNFKEADLWLMRAGQAWPNCPLMVFLTGEKLAANGEWEKAAESLETSTAGEENKWLGEMIARRARQIRDQKGETTPLIMDTGFLWDLSSGYLSQCAEKSEPAKVLQEKMQSAKDLASELLSKLPGSSAE